MTLEEFKKDCYSRWRGDWNSFAFEALKARLDPHQQEILYACQTEKMIAVASGTARGKDYVAATAALCFMYLTPVFRGKELIANTKVAMTAPAIQSCKIPDWPISFLRHKDKIPGMVLNRIQGGR